MATSSNWFKIAESVAELGLEPNGLSQFKVQGKTICVGMFQGNLFGCSQKCPHAGGTLADGYIDAAGNLVCPLHRYKFDTQNGRNTSGEGYFLKTYKIEERQDGIYIFW